jgi:hypothetical protein
MAGTFIGFGKATNPAGNNGEIQFNDNGDFGASPNLFWDNSNNRLGLGTITPQAKLDIRAQGALSTDIAFRVRNSADTNDLAYITGLGGLFAHGVKGKTTDLVFGSNTALLFVQLATEGNNIAIGNALRLQTSGIRSIGIGQTAADPNQSNSICIGYQAVGGVNGENIVIGNQIGGAKSHSVAIGFQNSQFAPMTRTVSIGRYAFRNIVSGGLIGGGSLISNSVGVGEDARPLTGDDENTIVIGYQSRGLGSNTTVIGNTDTTLFRPHGNVAIGADTADARLDIRAQGALSTDIALRVRNSADTDNLMRINGDETFRIGIVATNSAYISVGTSALTISSGQLSNFSMQRTAASTPVTLNATSQGFLINTTTGAFRYNNTTYSANFQIIRRLINFSPNLSTNDLAPISDSNAIILGNGTPPASDYIDRHLYYSADITAGNAAPHFRTENGDVIKLYSEQNVAVGYNANTGDANTDAMIDLMMSHLKNLGLLKES